MADQRKHKDVTCECSETVYLTADTHWQYFTSLGYPDNYEHHVDICWKITSSNSNHIIQLEVLNCSIEYSVECTLGDFIQVRDGYESGTPLLSRFCGKSKPYLTSTGRHIYVRFYTDAMVNDRGFKIRYIAKLPETFTPQDTQMSTPGWASDSGCKRTHYLSAHPYAIDLQSPGYPVHYDSDLDICWQIYTDNPHHLIRLEVYDSELENSLFCSMGDYMEVRDGANLWDSQLREWCGTEKPHVFTGSGQYLLVHFKSDHADNQYKGFSAKYWTIDEWTYDYYTVSSTTRTCIGLSVLAVAILVILSVLAYHKKSWQRNHAVATTNQSRGRNTISSTSQQHQTHLQYRNRSSRPVRPVRPESFPTCSRQYSAIYGGPPPPGYSLYGGTPMTAISTPAFLSPPQPPPYSPPEAPPAYSEEIVPDPKQGSPPENREADKPPPSPSQPRF